MAGNTRIVRPRTQKRKTFWMSLGGVTGMTTLAASTVSLHASLNAAALALRPFTVIRTIGSLWTSSDQSAASEINLGAFGMAVADDRAIAVGVTAVPRPYTDMADSDWFQWGGFCNKVTFKSAVGFDEGVFYEYRYDQRGQRKVTIGNDIAFVIENISGVGMKYVWTGRLLCLAA